MKGIAIILVITVTCIALVCAAKFDHFPDCRAYVKGLKETEEKFKPKYWPHETNCFKYYECGAEGAVYEMDCPKNLVFNREVEACHFFEKECKAQQKNFLATLLGLPQP